MDEEKPLILKYKDLVFLLSHVTSKLWKQVLQSLNKCEANCISEILANFLEKRLTDDDTIINRLKKIQE